MHLIAPLASGISQAASGTAEFFERGTSTYAAVYSDPECTTRLDSGGIVSLDAYGAAVCYVNTFVDVRVRNSSRTVVRSWTDGVAAEAVTVASSSFTGTLASGSQGAGGTVGQNEVLDRWYQSAKALDFNVLRSGETEPETIQEAFAAVVAATSSGPDFNVDNYGAVGDGATDDYGAIMAAYTAAVAAGGGTVRAPGGTYLFNTALAFTSPKVSIRGDGAAATIFRFGQTTGNAITYNAGSAATGQVLEGFTVEPATTNDSTGIVITASAGLHVRGVHVRTFRKPWEVASKTILLGCHATQSNASGTSYGFHFTTAADGSMVLGGESTLAASGSAGYCYGLDRPNITILGAKADWSANTAASTSYGVYLSGANSGGATIANVTFVPGTSSTGIFVNADVAMTEVGCTGATNLIGTAVTPYTSTPYNSVISLSRRRSQPSAETVVATPGSYTPNGNIESHAISATGVGLLTVNPPTGHFAIGDRLRFWIRAGASSVTVTWTSSAFEASGRSGATATAFGTQAGTAVSGHTRKVLWFTYGLSTAGTYRWVLDSMMDFA